MFALEDAHGFKEGRESLERPSVEKERESYHLLEIREPLLLDSTHFELKKKNI